MFKRLKTLLNSQQSVIICGLPALILCLFLLPLNATAMPLRALLEQLDNNHPVINKQRQILAAREAAIQEAQSVYLPQVNAEASYGYEEIERNGGISSNGTSDGQPLNTTLSVTQNLFEGFRTDGTISQREADALSVAAQLDELRQQVFLEATGTYIELLKQIHLLQIARQNVENLQNQVRLEEERLGLGTGIAVDVLAAKSRLQLAIERYTNFVGNAHQVQASFQQYFGMEPDFRLLQLPQLPLAEVPLTMERAMLIATQANPLLEREEFSAEVADAEQKIAKANYFPRLDVVASTNYQESSNSVNGDINSNRILLRGSWNLFSGFADKSRIAQASANYQSALSSVADARLRVVEASKRAWIKMHTLRERAMLLQNAVDIASEVYKARLRLRDIGNETIINVLDAENEMFSAQQSAISARYDFHLSVYEFMQAIGRLDLPIIY